MSEPVSIGESAATKAVSIFLAVIWYLCWIGMALLVVIYTMILTTDHEAQYVRIPVRVSFETGEGKLPLGQLDSVDGLPVVGFETPLVLSQGMVNQEEDFIIPVFLMAALIWGIAQLRKLLKSLKRGSPFTRENVKLLRRIGIATASAGPVVGLLYFMYATRYASMIKLPGASVDVDLEVYPFIIGLGIVILVIAQVFEEGCRLREENELTV